MNVLPVNFPIRGLASSPLTKLEAGMVEPGKYYFVQLNVDREPTDLFVQVLSVSDRTIHVQIIKERDYLKATDVPAGTRVVSQLNDRGDISDFQLVAADGTIRSGPEVADYRDSFMTKPEFSRFNMDDAIKDLEDLEYMSNNDYDIDAKLAEMENKYGKVTATRKHDKLEELKDNIQSIVDEAKDIWRTSEFVQDSAGNPVPGPWVDHVGDDGPWPIPIRYISDNEVYGYKIFGPQRREAAPAAGGGRRRTQRRRRGKRSSRCNQRRSRRN
jgi:hypothetical protein